MKKFWASIVCAAAVAVMLTGCGSASQSAAENMPAMAKAVQGNGFNAYSDAADVDYEMEAAEEYYDEYSAETDIAASSESGNANQIGESAVKSNRKLIRTVHLGVETIEYEALIASINEKVAALGGYFESMDESVHTWTTPETRSFTSTIRVPKDRADELITVVESSANVTSRSENTEDVTLNYVDTESRKKALETEQKRLTELLDKADTVEDLITIENRLSEVRYQIQSIESQLRTYDDKIDYTTIYLSVTEVERIVPKAEETFLSRIMVGFSESVVDVIQGFVDFVVGLIVAIPYLLVWAVIIFLFWLIVIRNIVKHHKKKKAEKEQKKLEQENASPEDKK